MCQYFSIYDIADRTKPTCQRTICIPFLWNSRSIGKGSLTDRTRSQAHCEIGSTVNGIRLIEETEGFGEQIRHIKRIK